MEPMEKLLVTPQEAFDAIGVGSTKGYELIGLGELDAVKIGRSTRVTVASIKAFVESAPRKSNEHIPFGHPR